MLDRCIAGHAGERCGAWLPAGRAVLAAGSAGPCGRWARRAILHRLTPTSRQHHRDRGCHTRAGVVLLVVGATGCGLLRPVFSALSRSFPLVIARRTCSRIAATSDGSAGGARTSGAVPGVPNRHVRGARPGTEAGWRPLRPPRDAGQRGSKPPRACERLGPLTTNVLVGWGRFELPTSASQTRATHRREGAHQDPRPPYPGHAVPPVRDTHHTEWPPRRVAGWSRIRIDAVPRGSRERPACGACRRMSPSAVQCA